MSVEGSRGRSSRGGSSRGGSSRGGSSRGGSSRGGSSRGGLSRGGSSRGRGGRRGRGGSSRGRGGFNESHGSYSGKRRSYDSGDFKPKKQKIEIKPIDWNQVEVEDFCKNFYMEHYDVSAMSMSEVKDVLAENRISYAGHDVPKPIRTFEEAGFPPYVHDYLMQLVENGDFKTPTPVQIQGWPIALAGRNMVGIADTGSGKTLGFLLPGIVHTQAQRIRKPGEGPVVLVLAPTRELVQQIFEEATRFTVSNPDFVCACVYGGASRDPQITALKEGVDMLVATPGRLMDFLSEGITNLRRVTYFVIDEADRMMDMGFMPDVETISSQIRPDRQTLMWTATWPREIEEVARKFLKDPIKIIIGSEELTACHNVRQEFVFCNFDEKNEHLLNKLSEIDGRVLVFCAKKITSDELGNYLQRKGIKSKVIHGDKPQYERTNVMMSFKKGTTNILIATDVASRGLDIKDVKYVVNYDLPSNISSYIHRIGRTGRAGESGVSISFFTPRDAIIAKALVRVLREANQQENPNLLKIASNVSYYLQPDSSFSF